MSMFKEEYKRKLESVEDAAKRIKTGDKVVSGMGLGNPVGMLNALSKRATAGEFEDVEMVLMSFFLGDGEWLKPEYYKHMRIHEFFIMSPQVRALLHQGFADYQPCHGSDMPKLMTDYMFKDCPPGKVKVITSVSPMDRYGYFSFATTPGPIVEPARMDNTTVIVEVNQNQPRVFGDNFIHISEVDHIVEYDCPLISMPSPPPSREDLVIADLVADLVEDGSTIQLGIGGIPNQLGSVLSKKHDLGAHSEMVGDAFKHLWELGVLNGRKKTVRPRKITGCFAMGSSEVYEWMHENPAVEMYSQGWTNDPQVIGRNHKMVAINQALEIDLTGQVASESIGPNMYSGTGGQVNFTQGAQLSPGGKAFLCMHSTAQTKAGRVSKIVPLLKPGSVVTTLRTQVQYVVTEYGVVQLKGKSMRERAKALISIAHPDFREQLSEEARKLRLFS
jgi:acyl-CoA hydrolase